MTLHQPTHLAAIALHAVAHRKSWGNHAARRYATKHGAGSLYRLACQLSAIEHGTAGGAK